MENNSNESDAERAMIGDMTNSNYNDTYIRISTTVGAMPHSWSVYNAESIVQM